MTNWDMIACRRYGQSCMRYPLWLAGSRAHHSLTHPVNLCGAIAARSRDICRFTDASMSMSWSQSTTVSTSLFHVGTALQSYLTSNRGWLGSNDGTAGRGGRPRGMEFSSAPPPPPPPPPPPSGGGGPNPRGCRGEDGVGGRGVYGGPPPPPPPPSPPPPGGPEGGLLPLPPRSGAPCP